MSEEPEVSPLRLKRPGAGGPPPPSQPAAPSSAAAPASPPLPPAEPEPPSVSEPPLMPLPGMGMPLPTAPGHEAAGQERVRRRPSLAADNNPAARVHPPVAGHPPAFAPAPAPAPEQAASPPAPAAPPLFKLKVGTKPPPPPPPASEAGPDAMAQALHALEHPQGGAPLLPLPGLAPGAMNAGMPAIGGAPLPPLPSLPPMASIPEPPSADVGASAGPEAPLHARAPIHLRTEAPAEALDPSKLPPPLPARAAKAALGRGQPRSNPLIFGLIFLFLVGAGAAAYFYFVKPEAAQEAVGDARKKLAQAAELPGKAMDDARKSLVGARDKEQARVDAVNEGKETPGERGVGVVTPGELEAKLREKNTALPAPPASGPAAAPATPPTQTVTAYAGEKTTAEPAAGAETVQASARFQRYAEGLRVSGVFQGNPARALIDGRLVREGDMVEPALGIRFADIDADAKQLILQDASGAKVRVKY